LSLYLAGLRISRPDLLFSIILSAPDAGGVAVSVSASVGVDVNSAGGVSSDIGSTIGSCEESRTCLEVRILEVPSSKFTE